MVAVSMPRPPLQTGRSTSNSPRLRRWGGAAPGPGGGGGGGVGGGAPVPWGGPGVDWGDGLVPGPPADGQRAGGDGGRPGGGGAVDAQLAGRNGERAAAGHFL